MIKKLEQAGYKVIIRTPYHWQVYKDGSKTVVNVWPTAHKILKQYEAGPATRYTDLLQSLHKIFAGPNLEPLVLNEAAEYLVWWREDPLNRMEKYLSNIEF